jgi:hypothetical protein
MIFVKKADVTVDMDIEDIRILAYALYGAIKHSTETHWVNYPDSFSEREQKRMCLAKDLFGLIGHSIQWDQYEQDIKRILLQPKTVTP